MNGMIAEDAFGIDIFRVSPSLGLLFAHWLCPPVISIHLCFLSYLFSILNQGNFSMSRGIRMGSWNAEADMFLIAFQIGKTVIFSNYFLPSKHVLPCATFAGFLQECSSRAQLHLPGMVLMVAGLPLLALLGNELYIIQRKSFSVMDTQPSKGQSKKCNRFEWKPF